MSEVATPSESTMIETVKLPRGGVVTSTCIGPVQLGMPPETIKDSMKLGIPVPRHYIVPSEPFTKTLGANMGVNVAEFEFPAYCNFFFKRQCVNLIVTSIDVETRIRQVFQETLFGPATLDLHHDFPHSTPTELYPDLVKELEYFRKFGDTLITLDMLLKFTHFDDNNEAIVTQNDQSIVIKKGDGCFTIIDGHKSITLPDAVELPPPPTIEHMHDAFYPPAFGVTVLGSSHGFDPHGKTSGYVLWINHRGIMIDPPPFSSSILMANNIPALMIDGVILTHCHADHDAGTFQKILQEGRVALITTNTIYRSFLRKYSALSGFDANFLKRVLDHRLVRINDPTTIRGATFRFFYSLHSIPCVGFEVKYGDKCIVFSGDHLNDIDRINQLHHEGVLSQHRCDELLNFPWHGDAILHEAGVPPIHTPLKTLMNLDESIRKRVYVVHTAAKDIPPDSGLRGAPEGVHNTIKLDAKLPENAGALEILDLVRKIDLFAELTLNNAYEILQMARRVTYPKGSIVKATGDVGDTFYIIIVGEAQLLYQSTPESQMDPHITESFKANGTASIAASTSSSSPAPSPEKEPRSPRQQPPKAKKKRVSILSLAKKYIPGDYFDLQNLLTPNWVLPYQMIAVTKLSLLQFNAADFNWFLRRTAAYARIQKLSESRLNFSYDTIESNHVFRKLTSSQRTMLEIILRQREVSEGQVLWEVGDKWTSAVILDKGSFVLKHITKPSSAPANVNPSAIAPTAHPSPPITRSRRGSHNRVLPLDPSLLAAKDSETEQVLSQGCFIGDVDKLILAEDTTHTTSLVCTSGGSVFYLSKHDLQGFLLENPGILMTLSGRVSYDGAQRFSVERDKVEREREMERPSRRSATSSNSSNSSSSHANASGSTGGNHGNNKNHQAMNSSTANGNSSVTTSTNASNSINNSSSNSSNSSSRRRRREVTLTAAKQASNATDATQSQSDDPETDSSSVAGPDAATGSRSSSKKKKSLQRSGADSKKKASKADEIGEENDDTDDPVASTTTTTGADEQDGDDEEEGEEGEEEEDENGFSGTETRSTRSATAAIALVNGGLTKRERSLSTVSTTSSSSSVASEQNEEDQLEKQEEKLKELEKKKKMVEDGTLAEYCRRVTEFKEERNQLLQTAEWHKNLQLKNSQDLYGFEVQRANNLWQQAKEAVKSEMLSHMDTLLQKLTLELEELSKTPDSQVVDMAEKQADELNHKKKLTKAPPASKRRKVATELPPHMLRLSVDDITADLFAIAGERQHAAVVNSALLPQPTVASMKTERRRLFCGKFVFEEGDEVIISSPIIKDDYVGAIIAVTDDAVYIKLTSGQKVRIYQHLIEYKRCELKPFLRGLSGIGSLQSTGWAECEPF